MTSVIKVDSIQNSSGTAAKIDVHGYSFALISDTKAESTHGGASSATTTQDRDLNTEDYDPDGIVSISSNQFTIGAGTYLIEYSCPAYKAVNHMALLYDVTGSTIVSSGTSEYANDSYNVQTRSFGSAIVTPTASNTYKVQHYTQAAKTTNGLGIATDLTGRSEIFTTVKITKIK